MKTRVLKNVPPDQVEEVMGAFRGEGCQVEKALQANGNFTITARCPDVASTKGIMDKVAAAKVGK